MDGEWWMASLALWPCVSERVSLDASERVSRVLTIEESEVN